MPLDTQDISHNLSSSLQANSYSTVPWYNTNIHSITDHSRIFTRHYMARLRGLRGRSLEACLLKTFSSLTEHDYNKSQHHLQNTMSARKAM